MEGAFLGWQAEAPAPQSSRVLYHSQISAACDDFVGRAPWPAVDPLVDLLEHRKSRIRASGPPLVAAMLLGGAGGTAQCHLNNFWPKHKS